MDADQQLKIRLRAEPFNSLDEPFQHVAKGVLPVMQLGVPKDVGKQPYDLLVGIEAAGGGEFFKVLIGLLVEIDPVPTAIPPTAQIGYYLLLLPCVPRHLLPLRD